MKPPITKSSLSDAERRLVVLLQHVNFGKLEHLQVKDGLPDFATPPNVVQTRKMGCPQGPREETSLDDFWLKQPVVDLLQTIQEIGTGEILSITIQHGLPHLVEIRRDI